MRSACSTAMTVRRYTTILISLLRPTLVFQVLTFALWSNWIQLVTLVDDVFFFSIFVLWKYICTNVLKTYSVFLFSPLSLFSLLHFASSLLAWFSEKVLLHWRLLDLVGGPVATCPYPSLWLDWLDFMILNWYCIAALLFFSPSCLKLKLVQRRVRKRRVQEADERKRREAEWRTTKQERKSRKQQTKQRKISWKDEERDGEAGVVQARQNRNPQPYQLKYS